MIDSVTRLVERIEQLRDNRYTPVLVAIDGRSGAGKSTFAMKVALETEGTVIDGDDFYAGGSEEDWDTMTSAQKAAHCIDWKRQRPVLETLARGDTASWHPYDWDADDDRLLEKATVVDPAPVVILEGVYSARPELADLFDLRVLYEAPDEVRRRRLLEREGEPEDREWKRRWEEAEEWYFSEVMPPEEFDLILHAE